MKTFSTFASLVLAAAVVFQCIGQDSGDKATVTELRREVHELRTLVTALTKKVEAMEYQNLPRRLDSSPPDPYFDLIRQLPSRYAGLLGNVQFDDSFPRDALYAGGEKFEKALRVWVAEKIAEESKRPPPMFSP
jgi:hypothetical protein